MKLREKQVIANLAKDSIRELEKCRAQIKELEQRLSWAQQDVNTQAGNHQRAIDKIAELEHVIVHQAKKLYQWERSRS